MWPGAHAQHRPDHPAVVLAGSGDVVTYAQMEDRSVRLARVWAEAGLGLHEHRFGPGFFTADLADLRCYGEITVAEHDGRLGATPPVWCLRRDPR